jgi:hypothetical protein
MHQRLIQVEDHSFLVYDQTIITTIVFLFAQTDALWNEINDGTLAVMLRGFERFH